MTAAAQLAAPLADTLVLALGLTALRFALLRFGRAWAALWAGRIIALVVLLPAIRLLTLAAQRPDMAGILVMMGLSMLALGAALLLLDRVVAPRLQPSAR